MENKIRRRMRKVTPEKESVSNVTAEVSIKKEDTVNEDVSQETESWEKEWPPKDDMIEYGGRIFSPSAMPWYTPHIPDPNYDPVTGRLLNMKMGDMEACPDLLPKTPEEAQDCIDMMTYYDSKPIASDIDINDVCKSISALIGLAESRAEQSINKELADEIIRTAENTAVLCSQLLMRSAAYPHCALDELIGLLNTLSYYSAYMSPFMDAYIENVISFAKGVARRNASLSGNYLAALNRIIEMNDKTVNVVLKEKQNIYRNLREEADSLKKRNKI